MIGEHPGRGGHNGATLGGECCDLGAPANSPLDSTRQRQLRIARSKETATGKRRRPGARGLSGASLLQVVWETPRLYAAQGGSAIGMARLGNSTAVKACGSIGPMDMAGGKAK